MESINKVVKAQRKPLIKSKLSQAMIATGLLVSATAFAGQSFDVNLAQPEKIIQMLERSGTLSAGASQAEQDAAYASFIASKQAGLKTATTQSNTQANKEAATLDANKAKLQAAVMNQLLNSQSNTTDYVTANRADSSTNSSNELGRVTLEPWQGKTREDHVLAILIEFPDYPHNAVTASETSNYYADYTREHYQDLLFSPTGYVGTDGENHLTMKQFYTQQSGSSYTVEGKTVGWVKAALPAAAYGNNINGSARALVQEALAEMAKDPDFDLSYFDQEDRYDLDGDGNLREPDGLIDHLMIFHSGVGEEAGGGALGEDAIWSHRWNLGSIFRIPGTKSDSPYWDGQYAAYDYTIQPIDAAAGVTSHEYAHDLGLPDEYDTNYSGLGDTVSGWSVMSGGSWTGAIPGYEPVGFSTWAKEFLQASMPGTNWLSGETHTLEAFDTNGKTFALDQANAKGTNLDYVRIDLPNKRTLENAPFAGNRSYWGGSSDNLNTSLNVELDLSAATAADLSFKAWYQIEQDWDYAFVKVNGETVQGNITTTSNAHGNNQGYGITGSSDGWVDANFDLSAYAGQKVTLTINYVSDSAVSEKGLYLDNVKVNVDGNTVINDDAEASNADDSAFELDGFVATDGYKESEHYYLLEWRNHAGVDEGLAHIGRVVSYEPGLLIWYRDASVSDNSVGTHPGESWLGVIDADVMPMYWQQSGELASNRYQMRDATFSLTPLQSPMTFTARSGDTVTDLYPLNYSQMADWNYYMNPWSPQSGRILQQYGLYITVEGQADDRSVGHIRVRKQW